MTNEECVRRYIAAFTQFDWPEIEKLRHPEWKAMFPQSGEIVPDTATDKRIFDTYPGGAPRLLPGGRLVGTEDRWVTTPLGGAYLVAGEGDNWWGEFRMLYPDGRVWNTVMLLELRDGKVWRETSYWAEPFDPPEWRNQLTRRLESA